MENGVPQKPIKFSSVTLSDAGYNGLSSLTTNTLHFYFNPETRTTRNVLNAGLDILVESANGWAHSNIIVHQNSIESALIAMAFRIGGSTIKTLDSSTGDNLKLEKLAKNILLASAPSIVSIGTNITSRIPTVLKGHATVITSLSIRVAQLIQDHREDRVNISELIAAIIQKITSAATIYGIHAFVPEIIKYLLPDSLGASVVTCITVAAAIFSISKISSWIMNRWREGYNEKEFLKLCQLLDLSPNATDAEIDSKYRRLALKVHPDKTRDDGTAFKKLTKEVQRFHELRLRYNFSQDKIETQKIIQQLKEFFKDPRAFFRSVVEKMTTSADSSMPMLT